MAARVLHRRHGVRHSTTSNALHQARTCPPARHLRVVGCRARVGGSAAAPAAHAGQARRSLSCARAGPADRVAVRARARPVALHSGPRPRRVRPRRPRESARRHLHPPRPSRPDAVPLRLRARRGEGDSLPPRRRSHLPRRAEPGTSTRSPRASARAAAGRSASTGTTTRRTATRRRRRTPTRRTGSPTRSTTRSRCSTTCGTRRRLGSATASRSTTARRR